VKRGEVWLTTLPPLGGSEQYGTRPVIIVSNDKFNLNTKWRTIIAVSVTTSPNQSHLGSVVQIPKGTANLRADSFALCHQVFVIDKNKLTNLIGELPSKNLKDVELALKTALYLR
jgi:mRNA interferase MazF